MKQELETFFKPKSIAIIGASNNITKIGNATLKNILVSDYECKVYPVNPREKYIMGLKCYKKITDVLGEIDLALIAVPAKIVPGIISECVQKNVHGVIIISSGFSEVGNHELENKVKKHVEGSKMRILGPNTMGYKNASVNLDASFAFGMPRKGNLALISQSGALGMGMIYLANNEFVGLSKI
ncbi:MAG: CoA-binding protein, partial [Thermoplasmatales archaeon]|nr:CoA-binding protein [Thermoplasmatales archaeon]